MNGLNLFQKINRRLEKEGISPSDRQESRKFFAEKIKELAGTNGRQLFKNTTSLFSRPRLGQMYAFFYDPKGKNELPFYDRFPLIFVIGINSDGFLGINLHYVDIKYRLLILDSLLPFANNDNFNSTTRLVGLKFQRIKRLVRYKQIKPTVKRYLFNHVRSKFLRINPNDWDLSLFLPVESFRKATKQVVFLNSKRKFNNN